MAVGGRPDGTRRAPGNFAQHGLGLCAGPEIGVVVPRLGFLCRAERVKLAPENRQRVIALQQAPLEIVVEAIRQFHQVAVRVVDDAAFDVGHGDPFPFFRRNDDISAA